MATVTAKIQGKAEMAKDDVHRLVDMVVREVSTVTKPANNRPFLIVKSVGGVDLVKDGNGELVPATPPEDAAKSTNASEDTATEPTTHPEGVDVSVAVAEAKNAAADSASAPGDAAVKDTATVSVPDVESGTLEGAPTATTEVGGVEKRSTTAATFAGDTANDANVTADGQRRMNQSADDFAIEYSVETVEDTVTERLISIKQSMDLDRAMASLPAIKSGLRRKAARHESLKELTLKVASFADLAVAAVTTANARCEYEREKAVEAASHAACRADAASAELDQLRKANARLATRVGSAREFAVPSNSPGSTVLKAVDNSWPLDMTTDL